MIMVTIFGHAATPKKQHISHLKVVFLVPSLPLGGAERAFITMLHMLPISTQDYDICILQRGDEFEKFLPQSSNIVSLQQAKSTRYFAVILPTQWIDPDLWKDIPTRRRILFIHTDLLSPYATSPPRTLSQGMIFDEFVGVSQLATNSFRIVNPAFSSKIRTIHNCIDIHRIQTLAKEPQNDIVPSPYIINVLTVARFGVDKGIDRAIRVHKRLTDEGINFRWYLIGDGSLRPSFETQVSLAGLSGKFLFLGKHDNPYPYMKAADIFVFPSYNEAAPLVVTESLSVGCPVISTNVGSVSEQIQSGKTGLVVENTDDALYKGLKTILLDPRLRQSYRKAASKSTYNNRFIIKQLMQTLFPSTSQKKSGIMNKELDVAH
jgi:glycosyltransferase involved in cell wall biosynthesis